MLTDVFTRIFPSWGDKAAARTANRRRSAIEVAVAWWVDALRGRDGVSAESLASFASTLGADLSTQLDQTYRVYLEVNFQPKGLLRTAALAAGVDVDAFPPGATMSVSDAKVEVSMSARAPYMILHGAA
jgi:hypothetical protein